MKLFENKTYTVLPLNEFKLFSDTSGFPAPDSSLGKTIIQAADEALDTPIPQLYASVYRRFEEDGNRSEYEESYFIRRELLRTLLQGEIVQKQDRYTDKIIDIVWLMLEETSWVIPAHNKYNAFCSADSEIPRTPLPFCYDGTHPFIDLFSAETGGLLSQVYYHLKDHIENKVPHVVNDRILHAVNVRILTPFMHAENMWWMGNSGKKPNNWNPWILSNVLLCCSCTVSDTIKRNLITNKALRILDKFIENYAEDGGCNEGPHYWGEAAGALFDIFEILDDMTGGQENIFDNKLVYNMFDYIRKVNLTENYFANFADSNPMLYQDGIPNVLRMANKTNNPSLYALAAKFTKSIHPFYNRRGHSYRALKNLCTTLPENSIYTPSKFDYLPQLQVAVWRKDHFQVALKGGHNGESHNHNDVGNMIVFCNEKPIFIDIGAPTYTKDVFSSKRYEVFPIASQWHNLPIVDGKTQSVGEVFSTNAFHANESSGCVEYSKAYSAENISCLRELVIGTDSVTVHEKATAQNSIVFHYYTCAKPQKTSENKYVVNGATVTFSSDCECQVEPIPMTDEKCIENWNTDTVYRFVMRLPAEADFEIKIEA